MSAKQVPVYWFLVNSISVKLELKEIVGTVKAEEKKLNQSVFHDEMITVSSGGEKSLNLQQKCCRVTFWQSAAETLSADTHRLYCMQMSGEMMRSCQSKPDDDKKLLWHKHKADNHLCVCVWLESVWETSPLLSMLSYVK